MTKPEAPQPESAAPAVPPYSAYDELRQKAPQVMSPSSEKLRPMNVTEFDETVGHLDISCEHDDRHAAMALRNYWPRVRDEYERRLEELSHQLDEALVVATKLALPSATQRSDMVLVPRHPSYQMLSAGMAAALHVPPDEIQARHVYLAMLAAVDGPASEVQR